MTQTTTGAFPNLSLAKAFVDGFVLALDLEDVPVPVYVQDTSEMIHEALLDPTKVQPLREYIFLKGSTAEGSSKESTFCAEVQRRLES